MHTLRLDIGEQKRRGIGHFLRSVITWVVQIGWWAGWLIQSAAIHAQSSDPCGIVAAMEALPMRAFTFIHRTHCTIPISDLQAVVDRLNMRPHTVMVHIEHGGLTNAGVEILARARYVRYFSLPHSSIGDAGLEILARLPQVQFINLSFNPIIGQRPIHFTPKRLQYLNLDGDPVGDHAPDFFDRMPPIVVMSLRLTHVGPATIAALATKPIQELRLSNNALDDQAIAPLGAAPALRVLELAHNQLTDTGLISLAANPHLESLTLTHQKQITATSIRLLSQHPHLHYLDLSANRLDAAAAEALAHNNRITHLYLNDNNIGNAGAQAITRIPLTYLSLRNNQLGPAAARALAAHPTLETLDLGNNQIGDWGLMYLGYGLPQVTRLFAPNNGIGDPWALWIFSRHAPFMVCDLSHNQIEDNGFLLLVQGNIARLDQWYPELLEEPEPQESIYWDLGFNQISLRGFKAWDKQKPHLFVLQGTGNPGWDAFQKTKESTQHGPFTPDKR